MKRAPAVLDVNANYDALGRKVPHRLNAIHFARAVPGFVASFKNEVPAEFFAAPDGGHFEIACPCGETPVVAHLQLEECRCGRWFLSTGLRVLCQPPEEPG